MVSGARLRRKAIDLLARREHSRSELIEKLLRSGYDPAGVAPLVSVLAEEGLQSDERFAEAFVRSRSLRGSGPVRIRQELLHRGVDAGLVDACLDPSAEYWFELAGDVWRKRFKGVLPLDEGERVRQYRFLAYRGFSKAQIRAVWASAQTPDQDWNE